MTSPEPVPPQDPQQGLTPVEQAIVTALATYFASSLAIGAVMLPANLVQRLVALGLSAKAARAAGRIALGPPLTGRRASGSPTSRTNTARSVASDEPQMRAQYVLAAAKRLTEALEQGTFPAAERLEHGYVESHRRAGQNRARAAAALDDVAAEEGPWLIWRTQNDAQVEAECRALAGAVFTIDDPPGGHIPGAVHPHCRCYATGLGSAFGAQRTVTAQQGEF